MIKRLAASKLLGTMLPAPLVSKANTCAVPAWSSKTEPSLGRGWIAIGDAAMAFDPLASAGLTKALLDVRETVDALASENSEAAFATLAARRRDRYHAFSRALTEAYGSETRYPNAVFWRQRCSFRTSRSGRSRLASSDRDG
jgi:2-polyprenyl-6-methoxyphenol hydroxylase-like FAD-dependent oxidoreductase